MSYIWTSLHQVHQPAKLSDINQNHQEDRTEEGSGFSRMTQQDLRRTMIDRIPRLIKQELGYSNCWDTKLGAQGKKTNTGSQTVDVIFVVIKTVSLFIRNVKTTRLPYLLIFFAAKHLSLYRLSIFYWNRPHVVLLMRFSCRLFEILPRKLLPRWKEE